MATKEIIESKGLIDFGISESGKIYNLTTAPYSERMRIVSFVRRSYPGKVIDHYLSLGTEAGLYKAFYLIKVKR
jgi:hypothetical protein